MIVQRRVRGLVAASVTVVVTATFAQAALAATPVVSAVRTEARAISASPALKGLRSLAKIDTVAKARAAEPELSKVQAQLNHAATVVARAQASTSAQKQGQADWVKGARKQATGLGQLDTALKNLVAGDTSAAKSESGAAIQTVLAGTQLELKGEKLLGLV